MKIKVENVRMGFATNSSSSHSVILLPEGHHDVDADGDYGWGQFTLGTKQAKNEYLAILLKQAMQCFTSSDIAEIVTREWCEDGSLYKDRDPGHIDHQSVISLPSNWNETAVHTEFFREFREAFLQDDVVVLGGNDNGGEHPLDGEYPELFPALPREGGTQVARWDPLYKYWTLFNRWNGTKIRMRFYGDVDIKRSYAPELVDMKITDYCPFGCEFCYQDSTLEGKHATMEDIRDALHALSSLEVFEVALGGGETTLHPKFLEILEMCRNNYKIIPNFTTKRHDWLLDDTFVDRAMKVTGAFAFSANSVKEVKGFLGSWKKVLETKRHLRGKANIQVVMGIIPDEELGEVMDLCGEAGVRLTLLGYKVVGRGKNVTPLRYREWLNMAKAAQAKHKWSFQLGIDTVLAGQFEKQLEAAGVSDKFYSIHEGLYSAYIDAVSKKMGPSSFCPEDQMKEVGSYFNADSLQEIYGLFA